MDSIQTISSGREERAARESEAYDAGQVWEVSNRWHARASHVLFSANTLRAENLFTALMKSQAAGGAVMDVGCGLGLLSAELHAMGARSVYGFDVSENEIERARAEYGALPGVTFEVRSAEAPLEGRFDLIVGRSVLHHVDFRSVLRTLFERNLAPGGRMLFMEPMAHPLTVMFHRFVPSAHTPDEWPLTPTDVQWLQRAFAARVRPVNLVSFPAGAISSLILASPDNPLMRFADRIDQALERRPRFAARGRQGIIVIDRPSNDQ